MYYPGRSSFNVNSKSNNDILTELIGNLTLYHLNYGQFFDFNYDAAFNNITRGNLCSYLPQITKNGFNNLVVLSQATCGGIGINWGKEVSNCTEHILGNL